MLNQEGQIKMGHWGVKAEDNDEAGDWFNLIGDTVLPHVRAALNSGKPDTVRAAAHLLMVTPWYGDTANECTRLAAERLGELMSDQRWLSSWTDPAAVADAIERQLRQCRARLREINGYMTIHPSALKSFPIKKHE